MSFVTIDSDSRNVWQRVRRSLKSVWGDPVAGDSPYSALFCLALLLVVGLLVKLAH